MKIKAMASVAAVAVALLGAGVLAPATAKASTVPTADEAYAIKIRTQMGLEADLPFIQSLESQTGLNASELGTPVTADELAELKARRVLGDYVNTVSTALSSLTDYAGVWFQQTGDGVITVDLTAPVTDAISQTVQGLVPAGAVIAYKQVEYTDAQLQSLYSSITAIPFAADPSTGIVTASLDTINDTVDVGVSTQADVAAVYAKYGQAGLTVSVTDTPTSTASRNFNSGPIYGGEWVAFSNDMKCTMGYGYLTNPQGQYYSLTAGHCAPNGSAAYQGNTTADPQFASVHDSQTYGRSATDCDCDFVGPLSASRVTKVYVTNNSLFSYTKTAGTYAGEASCHTGAASYESDGGKIVCGTVSATTSSIEESGAAGTFELTNCINWHGSEIEGDSGAPLGDGGGFLGIASADNSAHTQAWFTKSVLIGSATNLTLHY